MAWTRPASLAIADRGFRVVNFDYGPPPHWTREPQPRTCITQIDDVLEVMGATGVERAHVVGLSRGAITAHGLAARHPARVLSLVLGFPVAGFTDTISIEFPEDSDREEPEDQMEALDRALDDVFSAEFLASRRQDARDLFMSPPGTVVRVERGDEDLLADDETVAAPALVITGGKDRVVTPHHPRRLLQALPGADHYEFPGAMHGFVMEDPEALADVVVPFINRDPNRP